MDVGNVVQIGEGVIHTVVDVEIHMVQIGNQVAVVIQVQRSADQFQMVIEVEPLSEEHVKKVSAVDGWRLISVRPVEKQALVRTPFEKGVMNLVPWREPQVRCESL